MINISIYIIRLLILTINLSMINRISNFKRNEHEVTTLACNDIVVVGHVINHFLTHGTPVPMLLACQDCQNVYANLNASVFSMLVHVFMLR